MDLMGRMFVGVLNFFMSGRAKAVGVALLGIFISVVFLHFSTSILTVFTTLIPSFKQYVFENVLWFQIGICIAYFIPTIIGCYMCYNELNYISYKESRRFL